MLTSQKDTLAASAKVLFKQSIQLVRNIGKLIRIASNECQPLLWVILGASGAAVKRLYTPIILESPFLDNEKERKELDNGSCLRV